MNRTIISNRNELQHWGVKGMKWDKEKETPKRAKNPPVMDSGDNQNAAVQKLKEDLKKSGSDVIKGQTVTDAKTNNKNVKSLDQFIKDEDASIPNKIVKKVDAFKNSIFKEKTTYRTVGLSKPESVKKAKLLVVKKSNLSWRDLLKGTGDGKQKKTNKVELKGFKKVNGGDNVPSELKGFKKVR